MPPGFALRALEDRDLGAVEGVADADCSRPHASGSWSAGPRIRFSVTPSMRSAVS